ncbi:proteasome subunit beta type-4 [Zootermopsis nevadensis]|uniref:Proteasome subunit beta n=1 Tax=Zootermopsis nevadensis TaxID=136037 RepID=A0A067QRU4_ZOONE|nr:proteasome subunit beta type-4 [Zootermopsis nevadensis]KDR12542.1 Proteasome subunit beta type-4 [Zootermopsis nevadensis]
MACMSKGDWYSPVQFWRSGPSPGSLYSFPGVLTAENTRFSQRSQAPITTGTSVLGIAFDGGVAIAADVLCSYGSLARFRDCPRVMHVNDNIILGAGGDYADYQYLKDVIEQKILEEECLNDGFSLKPKALHCWLTRVMYNRRSKLDPFWNSFIVGGLQDNEPFLGTVDKLGTAYVDHHIATGYGAYMALPLMREAVEKNPNMTQKEAQKLLIKCLQVLYYRDARSYPKFQIATLTKEGVTVEGPLTLDQNWEVAHMVRDGV